MTYSNGRILHYGYNGSTLDAAIGRVDYLADDNGSGGVGSHLVDYQYLGLGTIVSQADGNGIALTYLQQTGDTLASGDGGDQYTGLDRFGRVIDQNWVNTSTGVSTDRFQYGYDRDGNALYKNNIVDPSLSELYHANSSTSGDNSTAYDSLNRLTNFTRGTLSASGNNGTTLDTVTTPSTLTGSVQSWTLDALGNWVSSSTDGTATGDSTNSKNELTSVGSTSQGFDHDGNTLNDATTGNTYTYDAWNRLVTAKNSGGTTLAAYTYTPNGYRVTATESGVTTASYYSNQWQVIETRQSGTVTTQNVWGIDYVNDLVLRDDNSTSGSFGISGSGLGERLYTQHDVNFDTTAVTDASGNVLQRQVYGPYGAVTVLTAAGAVTTDVYHFGTLYQGGAIDTATGLYEFQRRDYNVNSGRWNEADPTDYSDGSNIYQFADSTPDDLTDPSGEGPKQWITDSITAAAEWIYQFISSHQLSTSSIARINRLASYWKPKAAAYFNTNTATMGWWDLTMAWFWEIPPATYSFGPNDATTGQVKTHQGVNDARSIAQKQFELLKQDNWASPLVRSIDHDYKFGVDQAWGTLKDRDSVAAFLGSYHIHVDIECKNSGKSAIFHFKVTNTTGWESGTRFRKGPAGGGQHQGIIQDRQRGGPGIQLGGNMNEIWKWDEDAN